MAPDKLLILPDTIAWYETEQNSIYYILGYTDIYCILVNTQYIPAYTSIYFDLLIQQYLTKTDPTKVKDLFWHHSCTSI